MKGYIPQIGDSVAARRKIKSKIYANLIVGPVIDTWDNACRIVVNRGTDFEGDWKLHFSDWSFEYLDRTDQAESDREVKEANPDGYARMMRNRELVELKKHNKE